MLINMAKEISENSLNEIVGGMDQETLKKVALGAGIATLGIVAGVGGKSLYDSTLGGPDAEEIKLINEALEDGRESWADECDKNLYNAMLDTLRKYAPGVGKNIKRFDIKP